MASAWVEKRTVKSGVRHIVRYRIGGRESALRFGGSFQTQREAKLRRDWIATAASVSCTARDAPGRRSHGSLGSGS
jgi:hypothetical protein